MNAIPGADAGAVGFVCPAGFGFGEGPYELVSGDELYRIDDD